MNVLAPPRARLSVEVVHDLVCPWCYLGLRRLLRTLRRRADLLFDLTWRPFLLNPDMPRAGMPRNDYVVRKFGGEDRARRLYATVSDIGRSEGLLFRFDRIRRTPSSVDAHRLTQWATSYGAGAELVEALFAAQAFLASGAESDAVHAENLRAHRLGINGVPCFVVGGRHAIAGAQEPEVIERLLNVALIEALED